LIVCDEPLSSLDVSVQGALMNLLLDLQVEAGTAYLFISHDLAAVQHLSHLIGVMYLGRLVEQGEASRVLSPPYHPYTEALLSAVPDPDPNARASRLLLRGRGGAAGDDGPGCPFRHRCPRYLGDICRDEEPPWRTGTAHAIRCHIPCHQLLAQQSADAEAGAGTKTERRPGWQGAER
jgi:peptide/nickel transport system ATP-binding protein